MHAIPPYVRGADLDPFGEYTCPLCFAQRAGDSADPGWVRCPMVGEAFICLGCCIDYQSVARDVDFEGHAYRGLFDTVSERSRRSIVASRTTCLEHQQEIVALRIAENPAGAAELKRLRSRVARALASLDEPVDEA